MKKFNFDIKISKGNSSLVDISQFSFTEGKVTFIFGESGIGKSLISKAIFGLLNKEELEIWINKRQYAEYLESGELSDIQQNGFYMFQEPSTHLNPLTSLNDQLNEGSISGDYSQSKIMEELWGEDLLYKTDRILNTYPKPQLPSGGEKQRILAVMAFKKIEKIIEKKGKKGALFVFDEPTGYLDNYHRNIFIAALLTKYKKYEFTILFITHDYSIIGYLHEDHFKLWDRFDFREITKQKANLLLKDFHPSEYLGWLQKRDRNADADKLSADNNSPLVIIESGINVFANEINFFKSPESKDSVPLVVRKGSITYLKGESGSGKTTVVKIIMGLLPADKFDLLIENIKISERTDRSYWRNNIWGIKASIVFQHADEALNMQSKVKDVFKGLPIQEKIDSAFIRDNLKRIFDFEINEQFLNKRVMLLSGGEKQKLNLLRSLVLNTELLILDEPVSGMDWRGITKFLHILGNLIQEGKGILLISHFEEIFDRFVPDENKFYLRSNVQ